MPDDGNTVFFEKKKTAGWITFSRPERMNALSTQSIRETLTYLAKAEADPEIRVLVLTGQGGAFCAGMDMTGLESASPMAARRRSREIQTLTNRIAELSLPTIAAVNGVAMGAGLEVCLACDLVVASQAARFAFSEVRLGMIPCGGGTQRLARLIGLRRARDMVYSGRVLGAGQAVEWGLVNEAVSADELLSVVQELAERLAAGGRVALYQAKRCLNHSLDMDLGRGLEYETECFTTCFSSGEPASALRRFAAQAAEEEPGGAVAAGGGEAAGPVPGEEARQEEEGTETAAAGAVAERQDEEEMDTASPGAAEEPEENEEDIFE